MAEWMGYIRDCEINTYFAPYTDPIKKTIGRPLPHRLFYIKTNQHFKWRDLEDGMGQYVLIDTYDGLGVA